MNPSLTRGAAGRPSAKALRRLVDALPVAVVALDGEGRVDDCNAAAVEMLGHPLGGERWHDVIDRSFARPGDAEGGDAVVLADGRCVAVTTGPLGDGPGQFVIIQDVTGARAVQAARERTQRLFSIGETAAALSHQIRTPLASALLYVSRLERDPVDDETRRRCAARVRSCIEHLDRLVRDLLAFSGGECFTTDSFAVADLLDDVRRLSSSLLDTASCRVEVIDETGGALIGGSRDALLTVLQNLLDNAIRACAGHRDGAGNVRLLARRTGAAKGLDAIEITISDDGAGIPARLRGKVFEPFFTTRPRGTGLGLAVARALVRAHRGVLWIESEDGAGTTVGIRLPAASGAPPVDAARRGEERCAV